MALHSTFAFDLNCEYTDFLWDGYVSMYSCKVEFLNSSRDDSYIESVEGEHETGKTNDDVSSFIVGISDASTFPDGIAKVFPNLITIQVMTLSLTDISRKNFEGLVKLERLNLNMNKLKRIGNDTFYEAESLKRLYIGSNELDELHGDAFSNLQKLERLNLNQNKLTYLPVGLFRSNSKLEKIEISHNRLNFIASIVFDHVSKSRLEVNFRNNVCIDFELKQSEEFEALKNHLLACEKNVCGTKFSEEIFNDLRNELEAQKAENTKLMKLKEKKASGKVTEDLLFRLFFGFWDF